MYSQRGGSPIPAMIIDIGEVLLPSLKFVAASIPKIYHGVKYRESDICIYNLSSDEIILPDEKYPSTSLSICFEMSYKDHLFFQKNVEEVGLWLLLLRTWRDLSIFVDYKSEEVVFVYETGKRPS